MKLERQHIAPLLGIMTHLDETSIPLGGALSLAHVARYVPDRIQKIPGIEELANINNAIGGFRQSWRVRINNSEEIMTVIVDGGGTARIWNVSDAVEVTGGSALTDNVVGLLNKVWSSTYYLGNQYVAGGGNPIQRITGPTTKADITGSPGPPAAPLIQAYFDRLYVAGNDDIVRYSDLLSTNFSATNQIRTDEIPGIPTALTINSPTSAGSTIQGELVIGKQTGIMKLSGDPAATGTTRDVVSATVGTESNGTFVNTPIGLLFLGISAGRRSVYFLPLGSQGEPQDVGMALEDVLNSTIEDIKDIRLARAVYHDGFYKLFLDKRNGAAGPYESAEVWLDVRNYILTGDVVWFGVHRRKCKQAPVVTESGELRIFEVINNQGKSLRERTSKTGNFTDATGATLTAVVDLPLNTEPAHAEKMYDVVHLHFAKESNTNGNQISVEKFVEGVSQGNSSSQTIFDSTTTAGSHIDVPITGSNGASLAATSARLKIQHSTTARLDILSAIVQYYISEGVRVEHK